MYDEYESPVVTKLKSIGTAIKTQAVDAYNAVLTRDLHKDRDVQIGVGVGVVLAILLTSKVLFGVGIGYLVFRFVRLDDHLRAARAADETPAE